MRIHCEYTDLCDPNTLKPHPKNRNKHPDEQIERLAKILEYQGWRYPIKVSNRSGFITSGHGRLMAAQKLVLKEVPVSRQDYDSDEQEYADVQADNAVASWAELDLSGINLDIGDLGPDFDLDMLGIKDFTVDVADREGEDEIPEQVPAKTKLGYLYLLGDHRLLCGDSTDILQVEKLMNSEKADITFTSPPYNAAAAPGGSGGHKKYLNWEGDKKTELEYTNFLSEAFKNCQKVSKYQIINLQLLEGGKRSIIEFLFRFKDNYCDQLIWNKKNGTPAPRQCISTHHEHIFIFSNEDKPNKRIKNVEFDFFGSVIEQSGQQKNEFADIHTATYPIEICEKVFIISVAEFGSVYDPFGGSGSTLIACDKTNRKCFMMEIDPHYCDVIIARWEKYTGKQAELINE